MWTAFGAALRTALWAAWRTVQAELFRPRPVVTTSDPWRGGRYYQAAACQAAWDGFSAHRSQLLVMATGCGKTFCFSAFARHWIQSGKGNVLVLANRNELVQQGAESLERFTGLQCAVDQAATMAPRKAQLVMASIDTVKQQHRMDRYGKDHFSLIVCDEAHHWAGNTYLRPLEFFSSAKVLGVTATPDRADEKALGKVFDSVAYVFDILKGIESGYLVPFVGRQEELGEIQLDGLAKMQGDLAKGQLDEVMVRAVEGIVKRTLELYPQRQAIAFWPGVKSAEYAMERFNALEPGSSGFISAKTDPMERSRIVDDYRSGKLKRLNNVGIAIEGFDAPATSLIIQGRPTLSRSFYAQTAGRGSRVLPGTVDHIDGEEGASARRAAIAASAKKDCVLLDFVGNSTKHALRMPEDLLGGDYSDEEVALAKKKAKADKGGDVLARLEDARRELAAVAAAVRSKVTSVGRSFDPFALSGVDMASTTREDLRWGRKPPTENQLAALAAMMPKGAKLDGISQREASRLLTERNRRRAAGLSTIAQMARLKEYGVDAATVTFQNASKALTYISQNGWKMSNLDSSRLASIALRGE